MSEIISSSIGIAALLATVYFFFRKERREDGQTATHRLAQMEAEIAGQRVELANQKARQQGFQSEIENVADHAKRERVAIVENAARDHSALKEMIKDVPTMRDLVYRMVERLENTKESMAKLDAKMDRIVELLSHK